MSNYQLGGITHPNPIIDKKVKYFYDCFHYWLLETTKYGDGPPENHMSYLERMSFRAGSLSKMHQSTREPINFWLTQPEFDTETDEFSKEGLAKSLVLQLRSIASQKGDAFDLSLFSDVVERLIRHLNGAQGLQGTEYFKSVLRSVVSCLGCEHDLDAHRLEIEVNAKWLVVEYLRLGFDPKELGRYDGVFNRILSLGQLKRQKNIKSTSFPLPPELKEKIGKRGFKKALIGYLGDSSFIKQFDGMLHALQEEQTGSFLFRVDGVRLDSTKSFQFNYGSVTFCTFDQLELNKETWNQSLKLKFDEFFGVGKSIVATVPMIIKSRNSSYVKAKQQVLHALNALRYSVGEKGGALFQPRQVILYANGGMRFNFVSDEWLTIGETKITELEKLDYTVPMPNNISPEVMGYIERCDRIFLKGLSADDPDDMISCFWQYWETSFHFEPYLEKYKGERIIHDLSKILARDMSQKVRKDFENMLFNYAINNLELVPELTHDDHIRFHHDNLVGYVDMLAMHTTYPFLLHKIEKLGELKATDVDRYWKQFYHSLLWQLYEQRNFITHQGIYCPSTVDRLQLYFKGVVSRWRAILFNALEHGQFTEPKQAIKHLVEM